MEADAPEAVVLDFVARINQRDPGLLVKAMTPDHVLVDTAGNRLAGRERTRAAWEAYYRLFPDYSISIGKLLRRGDLVVLIGRSDGSLSASGIVELADESGAVPPDDELQGPAIWSARVRDGLLAEWRVYEDTSEVRKELGVAGGRSPGTSGSLGIPGDTGDTGAIAVRRYRPEDIEGVLSVFGRSVRSCVGLYYTEAQMDAWASAGADVPAWELRLSSGYVIVAVDEEGANDPGGAAEIAGFGRLEEASGVIDLLYVDPAWQGRGIGRRLLETMLTRARQAGLRIIRTDASLVARPIYESFGFRVTKVQQVHREGVSVDSLRMELELTT